MTERALLRTLRERTTYLRQLIASVEHFVGWIDAEVSTRRLAREVSALAQAAEHARKFGLPGTRKGTR